MTNGTGLESGSASTAAYYEPLPAPLRFADKLAWKQCYAYEIEELFKCDTENAFELKLADWNRRPWYKRLDEFILSPLRVFL